MAFVVANLNFVYWKFFDVHYDKQNYKIHFNAYFGWKIHERFFKAPVL